VAASFLMGDDAYVISTQLSAVGLQIGAGGG